MKIQFPNLNHSFNLSDEDFAEKFKGLENENWFSQGIGFIIIYIPFNDCFLSLEKQNTFLEFVNNWINFETNKQLNQFSKIFYEKIKKDIEINEL